MPYKRITSITTSVLNNRFKAIWDHMGSLNLTVNDGGGTGGGVGVSDGDKQEIVVSAVGTIWQLKGGIISLDRFIDGTTSKIFTAALRSKLEGVALGATQNSPDAVLLHRGNHSGTQPIDTITETLTLKILTVAERMKLSGVADGATANSTDAALRNRATHTGTQLASTISDFQSQVSGNADVAASTTARHTHANKAALDLVTGANTGDETPLRVKALVDQLTGSNRINAANIQGLPTIGNTTVTQNAHGFTLGMAVQKDATGVWIRCRAVTTNNLSYTEGIVIAVPDANTFQIGQEGTAFDTTGFGVPANTIGYLASTASGVNFTTTAPTAAGEVYKELWRTNTANQAIIINGPGFEIATAASGGTLDATPTNGSTNGVQSGGVFTELSTKAPLASPTFTGTPVAPTATSGTNTTQVATTAYVVTAVAPKANLASPTFTGTPAAPTAAAGTNTTQLATCAFVITEGASKAPLASPAFTGIPTVPTAVPGTNTTQAASTAFVAAAVSGLSGGGVTAGDKGDIIVGGDGVWKVQDGYHIYDNPDVLVMQELGSDIKVQTFLVRFPTDIRTAVAGINGAMRVTPMKVYRSTVVTGFKIVLAIGQAALTANSGFTGLVLYKMTGPDEFTLVAQTANSITPFTSTAAPNQLISLPFAGGAYTAEPGIYWGVITLNNTGGTQPSFGGVPVALAKETQEGFVTNKKYYSGGFAMTAGTPPATITPSTSMTTSTNAYYMALY